MRDIVFVRITLFKLFSYVNFESVFAFFKLCEFESVFTNLFEDYNGRSSSHVVYLSMYYN